jgi:hypothetical protein
MQQQGAAPVPTRRANGRFGGTQCIRLFYLRQERLDFRWSGRNSARHYFNVPERPTLGIGFGQLHQRFAVINREHGHLRALF